VVAPLRVAPAAGASSKNGKGYTVFATSIDGRLVAIDHSPPTVRMVIETAAGFSNHD
jgi:hypothetical protein